MLYGDLGRFPVSIVIKKRIIGFWYNLISCENKLSSTLYKVVVNDSAYRNFHYKWLSNVKSIFDECGLSYVWLHQYFAGSRNMLLKQIDYILCSQFIQTWQQDISNNPKCTNHRMYKYEHVWTLILYHLIF